MLLSLNFIIVEKSFIDPNTSDEIEWMYQSKCTTYGDIYEHLPTLYRYFLFVLFVVLNISSYGKGCTRIAEFGVRSVVSTWAFLRALRDTTTDKQRKLICVDLEKSANIDFAIHAATKFDIFGLIC